MKLTRKQIREGLDQVPIEAVLLGSVNNSGVTLTAKQKRFAEEIAKGETKAGAYRKAYNSKGKPTTAYKRGAELMTNGSIVGYADSLKAAMEAQRFATPAGLRALTIHELTKGALDAEMPPAQRVKCLELLGKITEVALFTERRETVTVSRSEDAKTALLASIRAAIKADAIDAKTIEGDELLAELISAKEQDPTASENPETATPPEGHPPSQDEGTAQPVHSNPHIGSPEIAAVAQSSLGSITVLDDENNAKKSL